MALATPKQGTRPTTDRTKEAIFSHLDSWGVLDDARVLDLFAGTGALGIEALSRGARELVAVEASKPAAALVAGTLKQLKRNRSWTAELRARVLVRKAEALAAATADAPYDVVFIDPPYRMENTGEMCAALKDKGLLGDAFLILVEHRRGMAPLLDGRFEAYDLRRYGDTEITFVRRAQDRRTAGDA